MIMKFQYYADHHIISKEAQRRLCLIQHTFFILFISC